MPAAPAVERAPAAENAAARRMARWCVLVLALCAAVVLSGCSLLPSASAAAVPGTPSSFPGGSTMARLHHDQRLRVGIRFDEPLFGQVDAAGVPHGFDASIAQLVATALGIPADHIDWVDTINVNREDYLIYQKVDIVVATYTINDERKQVVDFAGPYLTAGQRLMVRAGQTAIHSVHDLTGKKVCVPQGSTAADAILGYGGQPWPVPTETDCVKPLLDGTVDAVDSDDTVLAGLMSEHPGDFAFAGGAFTSEPYGIGIRKGDEGFRRFIDTTLRTAVDDGTWARLWHQTAGAILPLPPAPKIPKD